MKKIVWLCSSPTPYNDCLFTAIHNRANIDLEVVYRQTYLDSYPWRKTGREAYSSRKLSEYLGFDLKLIKQVLFDKNIVFVVGGWHPSFWFLIFFMSIKASKFLVWSDTPNDLHQRGIIKSFVRNFWLKLIFKNCFALLGMGKPCVDRLVNLGANPSKVFNFPLWIPLKKQHVKQSRDVEKTIRVVSIGRLVEVKGLEWLIHAAAQVNAAEPSLCIEYVICGDGPLRSDLDELIGREGLTDSFIITGWLEHEEVYKILDTADIYVHPAIWEPYGAVILEAMAAGLTILGSDNTMAALDRVEDGVTGLIHEAGNVGMITEQILRLAKNSEERKRMGRSSYELSRKFPVESGVEEFLRLASIDADMTQII